MTNVVSNIPSSAINNARQTHADYAGYLARQLQDQLSIPSGGDLVPYIGLGYESTNLEAIESWVFMVCTALKLPFSSDQLPILESILMPILSALKNDKLCNNGGYFND